MRPLKSHFPDHALTTLETVLKQTKEARYHLKNSRLKVHALPGCHNAGKWA